MRYPSEHKETVRRRIVAAAASALRRDGVAGISIPALMKAVGLTHGGFYGHFRDREELVAEAVRAAATDTAERVFPRGRSLAATLTRYLSREHVADPGGGCVLAALGTEARHQGPTVSRAFSEIARGFLRLVEETLHSESPPGTLSDEALALASRMIGAVVLARLVRDPALADRILAAAQRP